jgi:hypothetical protein
MERSAHKKTLVWQKKGATALVTQPAEAAPVHKVGLAKQLQEIAARRKQSCDSAGDKKIQTESPSLVTEVIEK